MKKIILLLTICFSCLIVLPQIKTQKHFLIHIKPLGDVNLNYINFVKTSIEQFYNCKVIIDNKVPLTNDILAKSKTRYDAEKILKKFNSNTNLLILTEKDIAANCPDRNSTEWGVLGLGYRPGTTCVVSTFRMKRNVSENTIKDRLKKVVLHEIGHNLGLDHCDNNIHCLMNDAKGTIKQVDKEKIWLCDKCVKKIK